MIGGGSTAWGAVKSPTQKLNNISIETSGEQYYDLGTNVLTAPEHVVIKMDDGVIIEADSLVYYGNKNQTVANGHVKLTKQELKLTADKLTYHDTSGEAVASGNAVLSSPKESYSSETIHYNMNTLIGNVGPFRGIVKSGGKDYYLKGATAVMEENITTIVPAGLTRCPLKEHPDYIFQCKKMWIKGDDIHLEKVTFKILGVPMLYLPRLTLRQNEEAPSVSMNSNQGDEPDLSSSGPEPPRKVETPPVKSDTTSGKTETTAPGKGEAPAEAVKAAKQTRKNWVYRIEANTARPMKIALGRLIRWGRYSNRFDVELNSNGFFSLVDEYGIGWQKYQLSFDAKTDLVSDPERELGITFNRKTWDTRIGKMKMGVFSRLLYTEDDSRSYQGVDGGFRFDYQPHNLVTFAYLYLKDLAGDPEDWDKIEEDFMVIKNYRLGNNVMFNTTIPLSTHYSILYKGSYNFDDSGWTSEVLGITREVCCVKAGIGWDFAKELVELRFKLNY